MNEPTPPRPPLLPPPPPPDPSVERPPTGPQALDSSGPPRPPSPAGGGETGTGDAGWSGVTREQAWVPPPLPSAAPGGDEGSPLLARYETGAFERRRPEPATKGSGPGHGRLTTPALVAWVVAGAVLVVVVVVLLFVFLGGGGDLPVSNGDAASLLPTRIDGFSVEVEKDPEFAESMAKVEDGAALVLSDRNGSGRAFVAAVVLDSSAASSESSFAKDFEQGLASSSEGLGEFSDVTLDSVAMRGAELDQGDYTKLYWWRPYRDAVLVVFASDERTGRKILEALVEQNAVPQG